MYIVKTLFLLLLLLPPVVSSFSEKFYKIYENENNTKIRGIVNNETLLAIVTEKEVAFGNVGEDFMYTKMKKFELAKNLTGNSELVELKFIANDTVIVCNNMECSICNISSSNDKCTAIASFPIKTINAESTNDMLFLRVVHEKNNASFYSFKLNTFERIGQKYDDAENEYKSLYSFSHGNYLYFVSEVKRKYNYDLCLNGEQTVTSENSDIVITQICNNDQSEEIISLMEIAVSCGEKMDKNSSTSYSSYNTNNIYRNIYVNNVTGITFFSKDKQLLIAMQDSPTFSFVCKFDIAKIEAEFCNTWNYCQNDHPSNIFNDTYKICSMETTNVCLKYVSTNTEYLTCDAHNNISNYCNQRTNLAKNPKYKRMESRVIIFGEIVQEGFYADLYGKMISSDKQLYLTKQNRLIKRANGTYHFLQGLPLNNLRMITPWDSKNGIIYVDPVTKDTVYFKDVVCNNFDCLDILHTTNVKCYFCEKQASHTDGSTTVCKHYEKNETYCGPLWQNVDDSSSYAYVHHSLMIFDTNKLKFKINSQEFYNTECFPITDVESCAIDIDKRVKLYFTAPFSSKNSVMNKFVIAGVVVAIGIFAAVAVGLLLYNRHQRRLKINRKIMESSSLNNLLIYRPKRPSFLKARIDVEKIKVKHKLGVGNFGFVFLAEYRDGNERKKVAVKTFQCSKADVILEIEALRLCHHENIVSFIGWMEIDDKMCIIIEYMNGGDLHSFLRNPENVLIVSMIFSYIFQILDAMVYLSRERILHRDLAARNCLLNETYQTLKISDFGLARKMDVNYEYLPENDRVLPFRWLPIEALKSRKFTVKGDIWSFAVLVWEIFERGTRPYENYDFVALVSYLQSGGRLARPQHSPEGLYKIMRKCWNEIPEDRPTFKTLQHEIKELYDRLKAEDERNTVVEET